MASVIIFSPRNWTSKDVGSEAIESISENDRSVKICKKKRTPGMRFQNTTAVEKANPNHLSMRNTSPALPRTVKNNPAEPFQNTTNSKILQTIF